MRNLLFHNSYLDAPAIFIALLLLIVVVAAIYDAKTFTIPNLFPVIISVLFIIAALISGLTLPGWGLHVLSFGIAFLIGLILFVLNVMGGGDVKLFAAIALWVTPTGLLALTFLVTVLGTVLSLLLIIFKIASGAKKNKQLSLGQRYQSIRHAKIPYGPAIAIGTLLYIGLSG